MLSSQSLLSSPFSVPLCRFDTVFNFFWKFLAENFLTVNKLFIFNDLWKGSYRHQLWAVWTILEIRKLGWRILSAANCSFLLLSKVGRVRSMPVSGFGREQSLSSSLLQRGCFAFTQSSQDLAKLKVIFGIIRIQLSGSLVVLFQIEQRRWVQFAPVEAVL